MLQHKTEILFVNLSSDECIQSNLESILYDGTMRLKGYGHFNVFIELAENRYHPVKTEAGKFRVADA